MILAQDETDWQILRLLQEDVRMTNAELAERIHRSESACHRRVRRLESNGVIQGYVAVLDQNALGRPENIFVEITLTNQSEEQLDAFEAAVADCPGVMSCHFMTGDADYLLHVVAADTAHYEQMYRTYLSRFPGVARIRSSFALRTVCKRTAFDTDLDEVNRSGQRTLFCKWMATAPEYYPPFREILVQQYSFNDKVKGSGHRNYATWSVVQWLAKDESQYLAARELAATDPTAREVADFVFDRMPQGTPGMDGPEDYLTVD